MTAAETLDPEPRESFEIGSSDSNGPWVVRVKPMRTRELLKLLKVLTRGAYWLIPTIMDADDDQIVEHLIAALVVAVPEAEDTTIEFVQSLVVIDDDHLASVSDAKSSIAAMAVYLDNPELDDLLSVLENVVRAEGDDLAALGNRIAGMLSVAEKSGQVPAKKATPKKEEPEKKTTKSSDLISSTAT